MITVAVANQKGGVGKTSTVANLGHGAALAGKRVLIVDTDPQGNIADSFGQPAGNELAAWLVDGGLFPVRPRPELPELWVIRSDKRTVGVKSALAAKGFAEYSIREAIEGLGGGFDLILLDCAPSIDVLQAAALVASDYLIIPTRLDQFSVKGVRDILTTLAAVHKRGAGCQLAGVLPTFYERTTNESANQLAVLAGAFAGAVWAPIPQDVNVRYSHTAGQTLWEYAPTSRALVDGYALALERLMVLK
jgi:chromosome partitioning protein